MPPLAAPPRISLPQAAIEPCEVHFLPPSPTLADLEAAYVIRGTQIAECDAKRRLAVETLMEERGLEKAASARPTR